MAVKIKQRLADFNSTDLLSEVLRRLREGKPAKSEKELLKTARRIVRRIEGKPENPKTEEVAKPFRITVNGKLCSWDYTTIDYTAVCWLAEADLKREPDVTWRTSTATASGVLKPGGKTELTQGMVFHCYPTDSA